MIGNLVVVLCFYTAVALSYSVPSAPSNTHDHVQCASVDTYTVDWFLNSAMRRSAVDLPLDNALFYTRGMTDMAKEYACAHDLITIWHIWDQYLYDYSDDPTNKMRCIHNDEAKRRRFFASMSEAYARLATGTVIVMHDTNDWANPPRDGIWHQVEYETMVNAARSVTTILKLREKDDGSALVMWDRELPLSSVFERPISVVLAIGRYVPFFLGSALDWVAGPEESARQVMLSQKTRAQARSVRVACERVPSYPFEIY